MTGTLQRLFNYAKATHARALENFTTEALAAAIRSDPSVLVEGLVEIGAAVEPETIELVRVETQVHVPGGIVDLVVELALDGRPRSFWIEVKAHAGLHGPQIQAYLDAAKTYPGAAEPVVLMLSKRPITAAVPTLRWNLLRARIDDRRHLYWQELRRFMEDNRMADDFDAPISPAELDAADMAHALLRKTARLAHEFLSSLPDQDPWKAEFSTSERKITATIAQQFRRHRRLVARSRRYPRASFGLLFEPTPQLRLWIEFRPTDFENRDAVFAAAKAGNLPPTWFMRAHGWAALATSMPVEGALDQQVAIAWLAERFAELGRAGLHGELSKRWQRDRSGEQESDDEED